MVELICRIRSYGSGRRHIEIPKGYFDDLPLDGAVVVLDKASYDSLKRKAV